jgi:hypothetical protein
MSAHARPNIHEGEDGIDMHWQGEEMSLCITDGGGGICEGFESRTGFDWRGQASGLGPRVSGRTSGRVVQDCFQLVLVLGWVMRRSSALSAT